MNLSIRTATPEDAQRCGEICFAAFGNIAAQHNFPTDIPSVEGAVGMLHTMISHPDIYGVVAEVDGHIVGSNFLDERAVISGIGPITVIPDVQKQVGRALMNAALTRVEQQAFAGVRLVQAAYNNRSLSLYSKLGFDLREPMAVMNGSLREHGQLPAGYHVRPVSDSDLDTCNQLCQQVHGFQRARELQDAVASGAARLVEDQGQIHAYCSGIGFGAHAVARDNSALQALLLNADAIQGPGILVPTSNPELFRWCLAQGLHVVHVMNLMSRGLYNEPRGVYLPSVTF